MARGVCASPSPPSSWERCLAALPSKILTTKTGWERSNHPIPCSCPHAIWRPWAEGTWDSAVYVGHELCGQLREAKGGHSLSALLQALRIEPLETATALPRLASENGDFIRFHRLLLPPSIQGSHPDVEPCRGPGGGAARVV